MCTGHGNGEILMWTPNMATKPVVKLLAHLSAPVTAMSVSRCGKYMASTGKDARFKIWDIRKSFKPLHDYFTPSPATSVEFSDTGLISLSFGHEVQVWKNSFGVKQKAPYMKHRMPKKDWKVHSIGFSPFEDVLGIVHD